MATSNSASTNEPSAERPWHADYPTPKTTAASLPRQDLLQWFREGKQPGKDFVLVDLRRADFEGGTVQGSLNLPAQSLYHTIPTFYSLLSNSKVDHVVWYCGSCGGRGTRAAGWFADYIKEQGNESMQSLVLEGGIKGWATAGPEYTALMVEYDANVWKKHSS